MDLKWIKIGTLDCYWCIILFKKSLCKEMSLGGYPRAPPPVRNTASDRCLAATSVAGGGGGGGARNEGCGFGPEDLPYAITKQSYLHRSKTSQRGS